MIELFHTWIMAKDVRPITTKADYDKKNYCNTDNDDWDNSNNINNNELNNESNINYDDNT